MVSTWSVNQRLQPSAAGQHANERTTQKATPTTRTKNRQRTAIKSSSSGSIPRATAISMVETAFNEMVVVNNEIQLVDLPPASLVTLFSIDGKLLQRTTVRADGSATLSLKFSPPGIYIVRCLLLTCKIVKPR